MKFVKMLIGSYATSYEQREILFSIVTLPKNINLSTKKMHRSIQLNITSTRNYFL